ncbi:MAG: methyltransferase domain-containing protein [Aliarcobacter sp.]|nr:methyltransferase domain-containing protein [Aliarcobacter sp.]
MKLENVVPWGRNFEEYQNMFQLSKEDLQSKILGCGDGPSSFNFEVTKRNGDITSIDPIYQFTKDEIQKRIDETSSVVSEQLEQNQNDYVWKSIKNVNELINIRLTAMKNFIKDYNNGKNEKRYVHQELPKLSFEDNSFDLVLSSHFLFLYSEHFDLQFHIDSILEMCRVSKKEVRIFPLLDLKNKKSEYLAVVLARLKNKGFETKIIKTNYEFQKGANELLIINVHNKF